MWLIALAVPVQGSAAVAMFGCGPGHHGRAGVEQSESVDGLTEHAELHSQGSVADEATLHGHDGVASHDHAKAHEQGLAHKAHKVDKGHCAPCASCCVVAALPATVIHFAPVPLADFFVPLVQGIVTSFEADGLERPPRQFLA